jgi:streptomycin 6-kinase
VSTPRTAPPQRLVGARSADAGDWLAGLPDLVDEMTRRWELTPERVVEPGGRTSMTVLVRAADGEPAALKLCAPVPGAEATLEDAALRRWNGFGAVRSLRCAPDAGALLLERLHGRTSLRSLPEAKAFLESLETARRLWVDPGPGHPFPSVAERTAGQAALLRSSAPPEVAPLAEAALEAREALLADGAAGAERLLLHGDFRQGAVLAGDPERAPWLAVGPEPVVGERAYDLARLVRDRLHDLVASAGAAAVTRRRLTRLADALEVDQERLRRWTLFRAVASGARAAATGRRSEAELLWEFASWL